MGRKAGVAALAAVLLALAAGGARAQESEEAEVTGFLVEEAYNQEAGELQQILSWTRLHGGAWSLDYSQEWPLGSERHQLDVGIPVQRVGSRRLGFETGVGDLRVGYRYQLVGGLNERLTVSPGVELTFPTGSESRGLGEGSTEVELALPATLRFGRSLFSHTSLSASRLTESGAETDFEVGESVMWRPAPRLTLLVEGIWGTGESPIGLEGEGGSLLVSPGAQYSLRLGDDLEVVPGIAFPIGLGHNAGEHAVFLYLTAEHPFARKR